MIADLAAKWEKGAGSRGRVFWNKECPFFAASALHAIATSNLLPAWVKVTCVDINPATVTKLADRGSHQTVGIVTDRSRFCGRWSRNSRSKLRSVFGAVNQVIWTVNCSGMIRRTHYRARKEDIQARLFWNKECPFCVSGKKFFG